MNVTKTSCEWGSTGNYTNECIFAIQPNGYICRVYIRSLRMKLINPLIMILTDCPIQIHKTEYSKSPAKQAWRNIYMKKLKRKKKYLDLLKKWGRCVRRTWKSSQLLSRSWEWSKDPRGKAEGTGNQDIWKQMEY